jgi:hypothetical protein
MSADKTQEFIDRFYTANGPCCAGCDWWHSLNSSAGECHKSAPVPGAQRHAMLGMVNASLAVEAGHVITLRSHHCGDFKDEFDWNSLPPHYLRRIGRGTVQTPEARDK